MTLGAALSAGDSYCAGQHLRCELKEAYLSGNGVWKLKYRASRGDAKGELSLDIDAMNSALLKVDKKLKDHDDTRDRNQDGGS